MDVEIDAMPADRDDEALAARRRSARRDVEIRCAGQ
jgi:hypothetical protein